MLANAHPGDVLNGIHKQVHEVIVPMRPRPLTSDDYHDGLLGTLAHCDEEVYRLIGREYDRQRTTLQLIAAESHCSRAVLAALGSVVQNKTTEGFAGARFHGGCEIVDCLETLAISRAKEAFQARHANVQPHSGTGANQILLVALLESGDRILSLSHGSGRPRLARSQGLLCRQVLRGRAVLASIRTPSCWTTTPSASRPGGSSRRLIICGDQRVLPDDRLRAVPRHCR